MKFRIAAALLVVAMGTSATAADLGRRMYTKAPPPVVTPAYDWSGFYIGAMGGYAQSDEVNVAGFATNSGDLKGGFVGGTIGYNWQAGGSPLVYGIEVDGAAADIKYSATALGVTARDKIDALGSVTGRLGYAMGPALLYAKGGYAWANNEVSGSAFGVNVSDSKLHSGYTVGGGLEYMFAPSWSAKAEYMYVDLDNQNYFNTTNVGASLHTIKGGVNYHFNWGSLATRY